MYQITNKRINKINKTNLGYHILADLFFKNSNIISSKSQLEKILNEVLNKSGLTLINIENNPSIYKFPGKGKGITGYALLEESHIAFHSWPEVLYMSLDIYCCSGKESAEKAYRIFKENLKPKKVINKIKIFRGLGNI